MDVAAKSGHVANVECLLAAGAEIQPSLLVKIVWRSACGCANVDALKLVYRLIAAQTFAVDESAVHVQKLSINKKEKEVQFTVNQTMKSLVEKTVAPSLDEERSDAVEETRQGSDDPKVRIAGA